MTRSGATHYEWLALTRFSNPTPLGVAGSPDNHRHAIVESKRHTRGGYALQGSMTSAARGRGQEVCCL